MSIVALSKLKMLECYSITFKGYMYQLVRPIRVKHVCLLNLLVKCWSNCCYIDLRSWKCTTLKLLHRPTFGEVYYVRVVVT